MLVNVAARLLAFQTELDDGWLETLEEPSMLARCGILPARSLDSSVAALEPVEEL